jgi:hypothetical protein
MLLGLGLPAMLCAAPASQPAAQAASGFVGAEIAPSSETFWTPNRLINAAPIEQSLPAGVTPAPLTPAAPDTGKSEGGPGHPPTVWVPPPPDDLVHAPVDLDRITPAEVVPDQSLGGTVFTESRVIPPNTGLQNAAAVDAYPYRAVGKLFFFNPQTQQPQFCAAAANGPRVIVTAAQCIAHGSQIPSQRFYYTNFMFVPAFDNGHAPYRTWSAKYHLIPNVWWFSGILPNPADFGLLEAVDQGGMTLGSVVGWLGWQIFRLSHNHFTTLAYPCNLDTCMLMQRNDAQTFGFGGFNTWVQGSNMQSGAFGGPWIQDFGRNPKGAAPVPHGGNLIVGVTSYGGTGIIGASQFNDLFADMRRAMCQHQPGNC